MKRRNRHEELHSQRTQIGGVFLGLCLGVGFGVYYGNLPVSLLVGLGLGEGLGLFLQKRQNERDSH